MDRLIQILESQHNLIIDLLRGARQKGIVTQEGLRDFNNAKKVFQKHLELEQSRLYPVLESDISLFPTARSLSHEMYNLHSFITAIFEMHADGNNPLEFDRNIEMVIDELQIRFRKEESRLFDKYQRVISLEQRVA